MLTSTITQTTRQTQTFVDTPYCVLMITDAFGTGYRVQPEWATSEALSEGWVLVADSLAYDEACEIRDSLATGNLTIAELADLALSGELEAVLNESVSLYDLTIVDGETEAAHEQRRATTAMIVLPRPQPQTRGIIARIALFLGVLS